MYPLEASKLIKRSMHNSKQMIPLSCFHCIRVLEMEKIVVGPKFSFFVALANLPHWCCNTSYAITTIDK